MTMTKDLNYIFQFLSESISQHEAIFRTTGDGKTKFEAKGTLAAMQGKQKVDGFYFASILLKPKDVRFYFFPVYTHVNELHSTLSPELLKFLKGKSCFHVKYLNTEIEAEIHSLIQESIKLYQENNWLAKP